MGSDKREEGSVSKVKVRGQSHREWRCLKCHKWNSFGAWYAAHCEENLTGSCQHCRAQYGFHDYEGWPLSECGDAVSPAS